MFDEVTRQEGGRRAARKAGYVAGSTVFQVLLVAAVILVGDQLRAAATNTEPVVDVVFVKAVPPPPPPPPAPKPKTPPKPKTDDTPKKPPPPPTAMIQPKEVAAEMKPPDPNEPPEEPPDYGDSQGGGVVGGVVGGGIEEAPQYAMAGFRKPQERSPGCTSRSMRVPPSLQGFISGPITVKFAVRRDGTIGQVQVMSQIPDPRIADIIRRGLSACEWLPGADAQGRPTALWVILPLRFTAG